MTDRRPLYVLIAFALIMGLVLLVTRLTDDGSSEASTTSTTTTVPSEWQTEIERLTAIENQLFSDPDPSRVGEIMTQECACYATSKNRLTDLKAKNHRVDGANIIINAVSLHLKINENKVRLFVVVSDDDKPVVDVNKKVIETSPNANRTPLLYTLTKGEDRKWKISERIPASAAEVKVPS